MIDIPDKFNHEKWYNDFRPAFKPNWGDPGQIHLDGEKDFPVDLTGPEVARMLRERCTKIPGLCVHNSDDNEVLVTSQVGSLAYTIHYGDDGELQFIDFKEDGEMVGRYRIDELQEYAEEVTKPLLEIAEQGEWVIENGSDE